MKTLMLLIALAGLTFGSGSAAAQQLGDPEKGLVASQRLCADCHGVAPGATSSPRSGAPTFERIAQIRGLTTMALSAWIHSSHRNMPLIVIDSPTIADISAYLSALKSSADVADGARRAPSRDAGGRPSGQ